MERWIILGFLLCHQHLNQQVAMDLFKMVGPRDVGVMLDWQTPSGKLSLFLSPFIQKISVPLYHQSGVSVFVGADALPRRGHQNPFLRYLLFRERQGIPQKGRLETFFRWRPNFSVAIRLYCEMLKPFALPSQVEEIKECYNHALQHAHLLHRERRKFLRTALKELALVFTDQPGLLGKSPYHYQAYRYLTLRQQQQQ